MDRDLLKERLSTRATAFASDPELVTNEVLDLAVDEAIELAGINSAMAVLVDIAFYRVLLQIGNNVSDDELKAYQMALKQITDPDAVSAPVKAKSKQRVNPYI